MTSPTSLWSCAHTPQSRVTQHSRALKWKSRVKPHHIPLESLGNEEQQDDHQVSAPHKTNDEHDIGCWLVSLTHLCSMFQALEHMPGSCWKCSVVSRGAPCWEAPAHLDIIVPVKFRSKVHPPRCISQSSSQIAMHCTFPSSLKDVKREGHIQKTGTSTLKHFFSCLKYSQGPQNHSKGVADE